MFIGNGKLLEVMGLLEGNMRVEMHPESRYIADRTYPDYTGASSPNKFTNLFRPPPLGFVLLSVGGTLSASSAVYTECELKGI